MIEGPDPVETKAAYSKRLPPDYTTGAGSRSVKENTFREVYISATWRPLGPRRVDGWDGSKAKDDFRSEATGWGKCHLPRL